MNGKTHVSSQRLVVDNDLLDEHGTTQMLSAATRSYGGANEIFIRPDGASGGITPDEEAGSGGNTGTGSGTDEGDGNEGSFG